MALYEFSSVAEPDYLKIRVVMHTEVYNQFKAHLKMRSEMATTATGIDCTPDETYLRSYGDGKHQWVLEWKGQQAIVCYWLEADMVAPYLARFDVKRQLQMTDRGFQELKTMTENGKLSGRNFGTDKSRLRQKKDKRDAGGLSFHVGSMKSDYRVNVSRRGLEGGYVEFQWRDKKLRPIVSTVVQTVKGLESKREFWRYLVTACWQLGQAEYDNMLGMDYRLWRLVAEGMVGASDKPLEDEMEIIERRVNNLPREAVAAHVAALMEKHKFKQEELDLSL